MNRLPARISRVEISERRNMKTLVVTKTGSLEIREVAVPEYNECQALVKMVCCGICNGTDAKLIHHTFKGFGEDAYPDAGSRGRGAGSGNGRQSFFL